VGGHGEKLIHRAVAPQEGESKKGGIQGEKTKRGKKREPFSARGQQTIRKRQRGPGVDVQRPGKEGEFPRVEGRKAGGGTRGNNTRTRAGLESQGGAQKGELSTWRGGEF